MKSAAADGTARNAEIDGGVLGSQRSHRTAQEVLFPDRRQRATALYLYGSTARDEAASNSDVDLFIDYDPDGDFNALDLVGLKSHIEEQLQRPVDLTSRDGLHPALRSRIEASAIRVF
ncbi:nucleotidyltransferase family protein [Astrobacterium formosum]|uniref:nucleotidyltransferase family protein n=1 Tax=Astrobacterium formosum TaxID=3069710 RepID=UPI003F4FCBBB